LCVRPSSASEKIVVVSKYGERAGAAARACSLLHSALGSLAGGDRLLE
jgi:hypothetical protein